MPALVTDSADRYLLDHLRRVGTAGVHEIEQLLGVTRTAVRQRLARLMAEGVIERVAEKQKRGRPSHKYSLTDKGERLAGDNYGDLVEVLWDEIRQIEDKAVRRGLLKRLADRLADTYAARMGTTSGALADKMRALRDLMDEKEVPFAVDESGGLPILTALACPYPDLAEHDRSICAMERLMISEALGESVRLSECRLDGGNCCSFSPSGAEQR
ncbi:MAG: replication-relaxation family protein [Planctomycetales bacterium]|nr:replication-relaxation family protein [Planctomycetales bacterium]